MGWQSSCHQEGWFQNQRWHFMSHLSVLTGRDWTIVAPWLHNPHCIGFLWISPWVCPPGSFRVVVPLIFVAGYRSLFYSIIIIIIFLSGVSSTLHPKPLPCDLDPQQLLGSPGYSNLSIPVLVERSFVGLVPKNNSVIETCPNWILNHPKETYRRNRNETNDQLVSSSLY